MRAAERSAAKKNGQRRYFTGRPCKRGHFSERTTCDGQCLACVKESPSKKMGGIIYRKKHSAKIVERVTRWRSDNKEKVKLNTKKYSTKIVARMQLWRKQNPEKGRAHHHNREARKRVSGGNHTGADIKWLMKTQKDKCAHPWCRKPLSEGYHLDHRIPVAKGGGNDRRNIQLLCAPCNLSKSAKHPEAFAQENGYLV